MSDLPDGFVIEKVAPSGANAGAISPDLPDGHVIESIGSGVAPANSNVDDVPNDTGAPPLTIKGGKSAPKPKDIGYGEDLYKTAGSSLVQGVSGLLGMPRDLSDMTNTGAAWLASHAGQKLGLIDPKDVDATTQKIADFGKMLQPLHYLPSSKTLDDLAGSATGGLHEPVYTANKFVGAGVKAIPGMALGAGGVAARLGQNVIPALVGEGAAQVPGINGTALEPWARGIATLVGAGGVGIAQRPSAAEAIIGKSVQGVAPESIDDAAKLMADAKKIGVDLTWDEAINHVTDGAARQLSNTRRVAENTEGGAGILNPMMAQRPSQIKGAAETAIGDIAPQKMDPIVTGLDSQKAAVAATTKANQAVNAAEGPYYTAAGMKSVPPQDLQFISQEPAFKRALDAVRNDPDLGRNLDGFRVTDVPVLMEVRKKMAREVEELMDPAMGSTLKPDREAAARIAPMVERLDQIITKSAPEYGKAIGVGSGLRETVMDPLKAGPIGDISKTNDVLKQGDALLVSKPAFGSEGAIKDAVTRLVAENPKATENLIHTQLRTAFDEALQNKRGLPPQAGGALFADAVRGNGQQARNLEAAVRALPDGDVKWSGLNRFLDVLEATGQAPQQGSMTSFNSAIRDKMKSTGLISDTKNAVATGGVSLVKRLNKFFDEANQARNSDQIARLLTDPASGKVLKNLASLPPNSTKAPLLALRLTYMNRQPPKSDKK
jgi:hypothetical protein